MKWLLIASMLCSSVAFARPIIVGSKKFTESVILGEVALLSLKHAQLEAQHRPEFGGTRILWNALKSGDIDVYPEYSGTIIEEILRRPVNTFEEMRELLAMEGIGVGPRLGFNNTYALGMRRERALELGISKISDLARFPELRFGLSSEFR